MNVIEPLIHLSISIIIGIGVYSLIFKPREQERI